MMRIATLGLAACLMAGPFAPAVVSAPLPGGGAQGSADSTIQGHFEAARAGYSGERARDVVAFVEKFWRSPGNEGFDASIEHVVEILEATGYVREDRAEDGAPRIYDSEELTLVADVHGRTHPDERFVFSAHLQEPGANDNAPGVGAQAEIARVIGGLVSSGRFAPARSISMIWGDEISSTRRYLEDDPERTEGVLWGMSLDMVGEDTAKTGGTFLIEKMPDPSAIWTRGEDQHTEWGSRPMGVDDMTPHYFNDFVLSRCLEQAAGTEWVVKTNPYEGGSDHVPFLRAGRPGLLLWHFTDHFYHTDGDRMDKVSATTLANVGISALVSAMTLTTASGETARFLIGELEAAALARLETEYALSRAAIDAGEPSAEQTLIVQTWADWYEAAVRTTEDIEVGGASPETRAAIDAAVRRVIGAGQDYVRRLSSPS